MKNKFVRIISPISVVMALILDTAVCYFAYYAYNKLRLEVKLTNIIFAIIVVCSVALAIFYTREVLRHGIRFTENGLEISFLDENNYFKYSDIKGVQVFKDTKASFKKNFLDRYSRLTLEFKDGNRRAIELGLTTKRKLRKIENEINSRIEKE